jgi:thiol-disulfide isomerase/thioredoxin
MPRSARRARAKGEAMTLISERDRAIIKARFEKDLVNDVKLIFFTQHESPPLTPGQSCPGCREQEQLLVELAEISPKLRLSVHDILAEVDKPIVQEHEIAEVPALVIAGNGNKGVRYFGTTSCYEFATLIEDVVEQSKGQTTLSAKTLDALAKLTSRVHIKVFTTPT